MNKKLIKCALLAILLAFASSGAKATMISHLTDNGGTTIDTTTNREWLDLTSTLNLSAFAFDGGADGWTGMGYGLATISDVTELLHIGSGGHLFADFPFDTGKVNDATQRTAVLDAMSLFGVTFAGNDPFGEGWALESTGVVCQPFYQLESDNTVESRVGSFCNGALWTQDSSALGVWAFRDLNGNGEPPPNGVPAPSTLLLLGIGLAGFGFARRKRA